MDGKVLAERIRAEVKQEIAELLFRVPVRVPVFVIAKAEAVRMNFLSHSSSPFNYS